MSEYSVQLCRSDTRWKAGYVERSLKGVAAFVLHWNRDVLMQSDSSSIGCIMVLRLDLNGRKVKAESATVSLVQLYTIHG